MYLKTKTVNEIKELIYKENLNKKLHILDYKKLINLNDEDIIKLTKQNIEYLIDNDANEDLLNLHYKLLHIYDVYVGKKILNTKDIFVFKDLESKIIKYILNTFNKELFGVSYILTQHSKILV